MEMSGAICYTWRHLLRITFGFTFNPVERWRNFSHTNTNSNDELIMAAEETRLEADKRKADDYLEGVDEGAREAAKLQFSQPANPIPVPVLAHSHAT